MRAHARFDFEVFSAELAPELRPLVKWHRIRVPPRPIPLKLIAFFARAALPIARARVDLVHVIGAIVPNRADVITVHYCHVASWRKSRGSDPASAGLARRANTHLTRVLSIAAERFCYRPGRVKIMACVSPGTRAEIERHFGGIPGVLTPNGIDPVRFQPNSAVRSSIRRTEGIADELVCLFVGGDWSRKGLSVAISALSGAGGETGPRLWVVGPGDRRRFERIALESGVADRVRFLGPRARTERFYQSADVFVLPTQYETFSLAAYEAASCGLPVVATAVSGIEDLVGDGESGLLVERESGSVATALVRLAENPELRRRMGEEGRRRAAEYTWDRSVDCVLSVYEQLLDRKAEPAP